MKSWLKGLAFHSSGIFFQMPRQNELHSPHTLCIHKFHALNHQSDPTHHGRTQARSHVERRRFWWCLTIHFPHAEVTGVWSSNGQPTVPDTRGVSVSVSVFILNPGGNNLVQPNESPSRLFVCLFMCSWNSWNARWRGRVAWYTDVETNWREWDLLIPIYLIR